MSNSLAWHFMVVANNMQLLFMTLLKQSDEIYFMQIM